MNDTDQRKKMISLRLSQVDYELLKTQYRTYGARNVSELARLALQRMMAAPVTPENDFATRLAALDDRVDALESLFRMSRLLTPPGRKGGSHDPE